MARTFALTRAAEASLTRMLSPSAVVSSEWTTVRTGAVYLRASTRRDPQGRFIPCIDLANVRIRPDMHQRGMFRELLHMCARIAATHNRAVFVEQVENPLLDEALTRYGYTPVRHSPQGKASYWSPLDTVAPVDPDLGFDAPAQRQLRYKAFRATLQLAA